MTNVFGDYRINVGSMQVARKEKGELALMTCELDDDIPQEVLNKIKEIDGVQTVTLMGNHKRRVIMFQSVKELIEICERENKNL